MVLELYHRLLPAKSPSKRMFLYRVSENGEHSAGATLSCMGDTDRPQDAPDWALASAWRVAARALTFRPWGD
jgi:hypothetical protein